MNADTATETGEVSFEAELLELLLSEQTWVDAVFAEITERLAGGRTLQPSPALDVVPVSGSARRPSRVVPRPAGELERSPPDRAAI